ncbi:MAG: hypothetical protein ACJA05_000099 [Porticoccus sp.]|jgi:hypothetical protein|tara:strand:- start:656 stop:832 length:177 start_codon:yes stop_codon:yes gene_type:complete
MQNSEATGRTPLKTIKEVAAKIRAHREKLAGQKEQSSPQNKEPVKKPDDKNSNQIKAL